MMGIIALYAPRNSSPSMDLTADLEVVPDLDLALIEYCPRDSPAHPGTKWDKPKDIAGAYPGTWLVLHLFVPW